MKIKNLSVLLLLAAPLCFAAGDALKGLRPGSAKLQSAGVLAFGPDAVLFVGDSQAGVIWALDTADRQPGSAAVNLESVDAKAAAALGLTPDRILINDMAVNPLSKKVYLSVSRGRGPDAPAVILSVDSAGKIAELSLANIPHAVAKLPNIVSADAKDQRGNSLRAEAITDLAYLDGKVFVAGLSNEEFASNLRTIKFPFDAAGQGASVEIYHGNHGQWETRSPVRTFIPYEIGEQPQLLAAYTCTPLVQFPVDQLETETKVVGKTIAELGNRNRPLDMISYTKAGKKYILMANSARGIMKLDANGLENQSPITAPVEDKQGVTYETIDALDGVMQLDKLDESRAVILAKNGERLDLRTIALP